MNSLNSGIDPRNLNFRNNITSYGSIPIDTFSSLGGGTFQSLNFENIEVDNDDYELGS